MQVQGKKRAPRSKVPVSGDVEKWSSHTLLPSFDAFKDRRIVTIDDLAAFLAEVGINRFTVRAPNMRFKADDSLTTDTGKWVVGVKLNNISVDFGYSAPCDTLQEALQSALGVAVGKAPQTAFDGDLSDLLV